VKELSIFSLTNDLKSLQKAHSFLNDCSLFIHLESNIKMKNNSEKVIFDKMEIYYLFAYLKIRL